MISLDTRVIDLTAGELLAFLREELCKPEKVNVNDFTIEDCIHGLNGLAKFMNFSKVSANRLKKSGKIDSAILQEGRKIIFSRQKLIECLKNNQNK